MAGIPKISIDLQNGRLGRSSGSSDGVAGLILTGTAEGDMALNTVYKLSSERDLATMKITKAVNPLICKDISQFYAKAGEGAQLFLLAVAPATTLQQMCGSAATSPINTLLAGGRGTIRLAGLNRIPPAGYAPNVSDTGIDNDAVLAGETAHSVAETAASRITPVRVLIPALLWDDTQPTLFKPRGSTWNRVGYVMAADAKFDGVASAAIGQMLGIAASIPVNQNLARVKNGMASLEGWLTNGKTPEQNEAMLDELHDAGYILYRKFPTRNGYYTSDDPMAAPMSDDYGTLSAGRTVDKASMIIFDTYLDELCDDVEVDDSGYLPASVCSYYEGRIEAAVARKMKDEISKFEVYIEPEQDIIGTSEMLIAFDITPKGTIRNIKGLLGLKNPTQNS